MKLVPFLILLLLLGALVTLDACKKMPNGGIPIYLQVDSPSVIVTATEGTPSQKVSDVWATTGATTLGAFEMPVKIPVLAEGDVPFLLSAGIKDNGIANTRVIYPFYQPDTFTIANAERGKTYIHHPVFRYKPNVAFALNADFEAGNGFTGISRVAKGTDSSAYDGDFGGVISLGVSDTFKAAFYTAGFTIPYTGREVYVEMNYKCDVPFTVGMSGITGTTQTNYPKIVLGAKSYWNKIYINFNTEVGTANADKYSLYFQVAKPAGQSTATIHLDNLKVVHYQ